MTTNKVCGKGKCKFTDEFCMSGDCPYDTENMLKNQQNFNISEGNVKEDDINLANNVAQRNSQDKELMKKIFPHKEIIEGDSVLVFPYIEEASPLKDVPQEVVFNMKKTIDHIADVNKKVSLTEQWKKGELEQGYYYTRYTPSVGKPFVEIELRNYLLDLAKVRDAETVEVLAPVPSYEEYEVMKYRSSRFSVRHFEKENQQLKELLIDFTKRMEHYKEVKPDVGFIMFDLGHLANQVKEVLK